VIKAQEVMKANPPPIPSHVQQLRPYVPGKPIEEVEREYGVRNSIKLASNENPLGPSPRAVEAIQAALKNLALYPDGACYSLVQALSRHWEVAPENLAVGNGSDEIIHYLGVAFLRPGDQVLTGDPSFVRYESAAVLNEAEYVAVPLREHRFDLEAMAERLSPRTRIVFIANPNNPTGTMVGRREVERFLDRCPEQTIVVMDEAYYEYVDDPDYPESWSYVREGRNVVILRTFSKIYALAALRVGYGMARPEIIQAVHQVREPFNVNSLAQAAAVASLSDPEQVVRSRRTNTEGREYLYAEFRRLGLPYVDTQANFILVDVRRPCRPVFEGLLRRGVIVRTADIYGLPTYLRVTIGTQADNARFIRELEGVLESQGDQAAVPAAGAPASVA
jgi:histidinol-phosphate aminotransferase